MFGGGGDDEDDDYGFEIDFSKNSRLGSKPKFGAERNKGDTSPKSNYTSSATSRSNSNMTSNDNNNNAMRRGSSSALDRASAYLSKYKAGPPSSNAGGKGGDDVKPDLSLDISKTVSDGFDEFMLDDDDSPKKKKK